MKANRREKILAGRKDRRAAKEAGDQKKIKKPEQEEIKESERNEAIDHVKDVEDSARSEDVIRGSEACSEE